MIDSWNKRLSARPWDVEHKKPSSQLSSGGTEGKRGRKRSSRKGEEQKSGQGLH